MKKAAIAGLALNALFLGACTDENYVPPTIEVAPPAWADEVDVVRVSKYSARVRLDRGEVVRVSRSGTDIGNGLIATRNMYDLYVRDASGVKCNWNSAERLTGCRGPNPDWQPQ